MKLKLIKETTLRAGTEAEQTYPVDSVVEIEDQATCDALIADGSATEYTDEVARAEQTEAETQEHELVKAEAERIKTEQKSISAISKNIVATKEGRQNMTKGMIAKGIKRSIETKDVAGFSGVEATEVLGSVFVGSPIYDATTKRALTDSTMRINYSNVRYDAGMLPAVGFVGEATTAPKTVEKGTYDAHVDKVMATVDIPNEEIADLEGIEDWIISELKDSAAEVLDNTILNGAFTSNKGLKGLATDSNVAEVAVSSITDPTLNDLLKIKNGCHPACIKNGTWIVSPAVWANICVIGLTAANIGGQLIKFGASDELLGRPVIVSLVAQDIFFGDLTKYRVGEKITGVGIETDKSCGFTSDVTTVRLVARVAGGLAASLKVYGVDEYDNITESYGTMVKAVLDA